jgi:DNA-directed RNA polymerase II subunit RPB2
MEQILQFYKDQIDSKDSSSNASRPFIESSNDLFGFNCSDISLDRYEKFFQRYQFEKGRSANIIEAFDYWMNKRLPLQIMNQEIQDTDKGTVIYFDNIKFYKPYTTGLSDGKTFDDIPDKENIIPMYPRDAMIKQETYSSEITVDIYEKIAIGASSAGNQFEKRLRMKDVILGKIPIIKGSQYCWLRDMSDAERIAVGECFNDPLGYFIIEGSEKAMIAEEKLMAGKMLISKFPPYTKSDINGIKMTSLLTTSSINISLFVDRKNNNMIDLIFNNRSVPIPSLIMSLILQFLFDKELIRIVSSSSQPGKTMMKTCRDVLENIIVPEILDFVNPNEVKAVNAHIRSTIIKSLSAIEQEINKTGGDEVQGDETNILDPIDIFTKIINRVKNAAHKFDKIEDELRVNVFPSGSDDSASAESFNDFDRRRIMLSKMIATYLRHLTGFRPEDDRDSYAHKRIETVGRHMEKNCNGILSYIMKEFTLRTLKIPNHKFTEKFETKIKSTAKTGSKRENFAEELNRLTPAAMYSQIQKVANASEPKSAIRKIRFLQPSQVGYICTGDSPDGTNVGILKHLTTMCWISIPRDEDIIDEIVSEFLKESKETETCIPILMNGIILGWVDSIEYLLLKKAMKTNLDTYDVTVALNNTDSQIDIFSTGSIPTRPLLTINPETGLIWLDSLTDEELASISIDDLIIGGYIEYNSPAELESKFKVALPKGDSPLWLELNKGYQYIKISEYVQDVELLAKSHDNGKSLDEQPYTHAEIVPHFQFGYASACVPKANHNRGPRVTFQSNMFKQAISGFHSSHVTRFDTGFKLNQFPTRTIFETSAHNPIGLNVMPSTSTAIIAIYVRPKNNEDALVGKAEYLDNNLRYVYYSTYSIFIKNTDEIGVRPENFNDPKLHALYKPEDGVAADLIGFPKLGSYVKAGDAIMGKYDIVMDKDSPKTKYKPNHAKVGVGKEGYIVAVESTRISKIEKVIRVKIAQYRRQVTGDKIASRYAQKGTFGEIVSERDLPRIVGGPNDGVVPDLIFNPHSIPSRLTQGKIIEIHSSKASLYTGKRVNASPFGEYLNDDYTKQYEEILKANGMEESGLETLRHPDGSLVEAKIFVGACGYQILKHHVVDKFQMRDTKSYEPLTHQPVRGKAKEGGIRMGEMERDVVISHGNTRVCLDRMMISSDLFKVIVCKKCGNIAVSNFDPQNTRCKFCPESTEFGVVTIPYIAHLIIRMLNAANIHIHFKF